VIHKQEVWTSVRFTGTIALVGPAILVTLVLELQTFLPRWMFGAFLWFVTRFYLVRSHSTRNPTLEQSMLKYEIQNLDHFFHKIVLTRSAAASVAAGSNLLISNQHSLTFVQGSSLQKHSAWESLISNLVCICFHISSQTTNEPGGHLMKFLSLSVQ
jgi:hypothetical protein